jgi:hypothetical protein
MTDSPHGREIILPSATDPFGAGYLDYLEMRDACPYPLETKAARVWLDGWFAGAKEDRPA